MKEHNFVYNYGFLADWFNANPGIKRNDVLTAMDMGDYATLQSWTRGATMMPLTQMMKFCNRFNVPISAFFYDECADEGSVFTPIDTNAMIEPAGGWPDGTRKAGIKLCDPRCNTHIESNMPAYVHTINNITNSAQPDPEHTTSDLTLKERMAYLDTINTLSARIVELTHDAVAKQDTINKLTQRLSDMLEERPYKVVRQYEPETEEHINMVAED